MDHKISTVLACSCLLALVFATSCGDDPTGPEVVTIAGIVRNVDNGQLAPGIRVKLYGTNYQDDVATGTDGRYSIEVPKGSRLLLFTDDFDTAAADVWFPLLNVDLPHLFANQNMLDWPIHGCPHTTCPSRGSVAAWNRFLQESDDLNGDRFVPVSAAAAGGILAVLFRDVVATPDTAYRQSTADISITSNTPAFPIGYIRREAFFNTTTPGGPDCSLGPDIFFPASRTVTDASGTILSFGDPAFVGNSVTLTIVDQNPTRQYAISTPWEVPVAPGMITLALPGIVNGVPNRTFRDWACALGVILCVP